MAGDTQSFIFKYALTSISAVCAESVTFPIDTIKTRLQLQGQQGDAIPRLGALQTAVSVVKNEGARKLYTGLSPALVRHVFYTGTRISVYEALKARLQADGQAPGLALKLGMGLTAGAVGQLVAVPADLVKVRMQAQARDAAVMAAAAAASGGGSGGGVGGQYGAPQQMGSWQMFRTIAAEKGLRGLWRGAAPAVQRAALVNLGELATYDQAKQMVLAAGWFGDGVGAHAAASVCSGFFASVASTPADVVKTRMMGQDPAAPLYRSSLHCLLTTARLEGPAALYKGFFPTWARLGPWQLVFWTSYEQLRAVSAMPSF